MDCSVIGFMVILSVSSSLPANTCPTMIPRQASGQWLQKYD
ncbi:hypothetical protein CLOSCI_01556 [[Clostridium] scindens ATCC 35704]|nr:hypothetical protein CLOSCI_01556 [[Clostridium] scindens ATCC 35704]